jgi:hypothetical protein
MDQKKAVCGAGNWLNRCVAQVAVPDPAVQRGGVSLPAFAELIDQTFLLMNSAGRAVPVEWHCRRATGGGRGAETGWLPSLRRAQWMVHHCLFHKYVRTIAIISNVACYALYGLLAPNQMFKCDCLNLAFAAYWFLDVIGAIVQAGGFEAFW